MGHLSFIKSLFTKRKRRLRHTSKDTNVWNAWSTGQTWLSEYSRSHPKMIRAQTTGTHLQALAFLHVIAFPQVNRHLLHLCMCQTQCSTEAKINKKWTCPQWADNLLTAADKRDLIYATAQDQMYRQISLHNGLVNTLRITEGLSQITQISIYHRLVL